MFVSLDFGRFPGKLSFNYGEIKFRDVTLAYPRSAIMTCASPNASTLHHYPCRDEILCVSGQTIVTWTKPNESAQHFYTCLRRSWIEKHHLKTTS